MKNLIVKKSGIYRHEIYGPYDSLDDAVEAASTKMMSEKDPHYFYEILIMDDHTSLLETVCTVKWNYATKELDTFYKVKK